MVARRPFTRQRSKTAFVLSGGGNLGALQVGMLRALDEFGIVPDVVLGCSVGALNGAAYALRPDTTGVDELVRFWTATTSDEVMPSSRLPSMVQLLRRGESLHPSDGLRRGVESLLGASRRFDELVLPFQCVAAEVETALRPGSATVRSARRSRVAASGGSTVVTSTVGSTSTAGS